MTEEIICDEDEQLLNEMFSLKKKKKKKDKDKDREKDSREKDKEKNDFNKYEFEYDPPTYSYKDLLDRLYSNIDDNSSEFTHKKNILKMPIVQRMGLKKTGWINFKDCCLNLGKEQTHIQSFLINELSTECNIDSHGYLIIKGKYNNKNIETVLRKYIIDYAQCLICKSLETTTRRDVSSRLNFLDCTACKSTRVLQQINTAPKKQIK